MEVDTVHNSIIKLSTSTDFSTATTVLYESGSFKRVSNYNKILDNSELILTSQNLQTTIDLVKEGLWVWVDRELKYIVDTYKKTRVSNLGGVSKRKVTLKLVSLSIILQKIIMPNKSISQPIATGSTQKTVKGEMEKLVELYGSQYKGYTNWLVNYPDSDEIVDEYKWTQPTLFEALCDLASDANLTPRVGYNSTNDLFIIYFDTLTNDEGEQFDDSKLNGLEINGSLENNPGRMVNILSSVVSNRYIPEKNLYLKSDIGVMDDLDDSAYIPTAFGIEDISSVRVKGNLADAGNSHAAGYIEYDITDYVLEHSVFNSLPTYGGFASTITDIYNYANGNIYYDLGEKNIQGIRTPYKLALSWGGGTFTIINILNYMSKFVTGGKVITDIALVEGQSYNVFNNDDESNLVYDITYKPIFNMRYDITKDTGYGSMVQNQSDSYVSFSNYETQQQDIMNRLGSEEVILMGQIFEESDLPENGMLYGEKLIVQTTVIEFKNHYNFMCIATSKFNRVDSDAVINTKKRFWQINTENIVERNEFYQLTAFTQSIFDDTLRYCNYFLLKTYDSSDNLLQQVYMPMLKQKITDSKYLLSARTLDNKYVGKRIVEDGTTRYIEGVFYTDEDTGEFDHANLLMVNITSTDFDDWKQFPQYSSALPYTAYDDIENVIKYKDSGEQIAFTIEYSI